MSELGRAIAESVRVDWTESRAKAVEAGARVRRRRRAMARAAVAAVAAFALVLAARAVANRGGEPPESTQLATWAPLELHFDDGSTAHSLVVGGKLEPVLAPAGQIAVALDTGTWQIHVADRPGRTFRVIAGGTTIEAHSAAFTAARGEHGVYVVVVAGSVTVIAADRHCDLVAGTTYSPDTDCSPATPPVRETVELPPPAPEPAKPAHAVPARPAATAPPSWRDLARAGRYDDAHDILARPDAPPVADEISELLLAADVDRLSHHPGEAVAPLRRIVRDHAGDPRAPLAAFTLGRVLLNELASPHDAALAFADAERLAPDGPLAEDALAREVEAYARARESAAAERAAAEYARRFPDGRMLTSVRALGSSR